MSEEEKEAIKCLKIMSEKSDEPFKFAMETILNLVEKQQKEIELLKNKNKEFIRKIAIATFNQQIKYDQELDLFNKGRKIELEKKDKIIDLLLPRVYLTEKENKEIMAHIEYTLDRNKEFEYYVKRYFERKVEEKE